MNEEDGNHLRLPSLFSFGINPNYNTYLLMYQSMFDINQYYSNLICQFL